MALHFNPPGLWQPNGRAFNQGVIQPEGRVVHVTGQVAWDETSTVIGIDDAAIQLAKSFDNVALVLAAAGGLLSDVVSMTIYYLDPADLPAIQRVRADYFPASTAPASILIQVTGLVHPDLLVEVVPIAVIPPDRYQEPAG